MAQNKEMSVIDIKAIRDLNDYERKLIEFRHRRLRKHLQSKGTQSTRRRLRKLVGKERRFATDINHQISKHIVAKAEHTGRECP